MMRRMPELAPQRRAVAQAARAARRKQIHSLRMRVAALAVSVFVAVWATVFVRLVEGHDPALASTSGAVVTQSADPEVTTEDASESADETAGAPTAVTTRQS